MARRAKYTVVNAPPALRKRWARKAAETRKRCAKVRARLKSCGQQVAACASSVASTPVAQILRPRYTPSYVSEGGWDETEHHEEERSVLPRYRSAGRPVAANPELLVVHNPGGRRRKGRAFGLVIRRKGNSMKRRRRKNPTTARFGGRRLSWRSFVKKVVGKKRRGRKISLKRAGAMWRKLKKHYTGKTRKTRSRRKGRRSRRSFRRSRRVGGSWKSLVKRFGVKRASCMYRKGSRSKRSKSRNRRRR